MKWRIIIISMVILWACNTNSQQSENANTVNQPNQEVAWLYDWLSAWELMATSIFRIEAVQPPEMLFFDDKYVYTSSTVSAPNGISFDGPELYGQKIEWLKQAHNDTLTIPDGRKVPIQLMTFAAPSAKEGVEAFFVMAAPSFWEKAGINSDEVQLKDMLTGVFLHEFAHTRQMNGIGARITDYENRYQLAHPISDDIIQDYFSDDSLYVSLFRSEVELLYQLANPAHEGLSRESLVEAMNKIKTRHEKYFKPENEILIEMDKIFLTMEGTGQYAMVAWLSHSEGGNYDRETAIKAARRKKSWWSQEEGLALILLYERMAKDPDWKILFSQNPKDIVTLIREEIN